VVGVKPGGLIVDDKWFISADGPDAGGHATLHITPERLWRQRNASRTGMRPLLVSGPLVPEKVIRENTGTLPL
jgi:hypothetical protein